MNVTNQFLRCTWRNIRQWKIIIFALLILATILTLISFRKSKEETLLHNPSPVPNVVHFVHFINKEDGKHSKESEELDFYSATCILAVFLNHNPAKVVYHTNVDVDQSKSNFWSILFRVLTPARLEIRKTQRPTHVFGQRLTSVQVRMTKFWVSSKTNIWLLTIKY